MTKKADEIVRGVMYAVFASTGASIVINNRIEVKDFLEQIWESVCCMGIGGTESAYLGIATFIFATFYFYDSWTCESSFEESPFVVIVGWLCYIFQMATLGNETNYISKIFGILGTMLITGDLICGMVKEWERMEKKDIVLLMIWMVLNIIWIICLGCTLAFPNYSLIIIVVFIFVEIILRFFLKFFLGGVTKKRF